MQSCDMRATCTGDPAEMERTTNWVVASQPCAWWWCRSLLVGGGARERGGHKDGKSPPRKLTRKGHNRVAVPPACA